MSAATKPAAPPAQPAPPALGARVKAERLARRWSQRELAKRSGVAQTSIAELEAREARASSHLGALARAFGITAQVLLGEDPGAPANAVREKIAPEIRGVETLLAVANILPAGFNPRKDFTSDDAKAKLNDLADSLAEVGQLENLIVARPLIAGRPWRLVAGERRWRAFQILARRGKWDVKADNVRVTVISGDDAHLRAVALIENLQRDDIKPLEEAEAFAELAKLLQPAALITKPGEAPGKSEKPRPVTEIIAKRINKTPEYVQQRLRLVNRLTPKVQEALRKDEIDFTRARALAVIHDPKAQEKALKEITEDRHKARRTEGELEADFTKALPRVGFELFDLKLYTGEFHDGRLPPWQGSRPIRQFTDAKQFWKLQDAEIKAKIEKLKPKCAFVDERRGEPKAWAYPKAGKKQASKAGAVIWVEQSGKVTVWQGRVQREESAGPGSDMRDWREQQRKAEEQRKAIETAEQAFTPALVAKLTSLDALRLVLAQLEGHAVLRANLGNRKPMPVGQILAQTREDLIAAINERVPKLMVAVNWKGEVHPLAAAIAQGAGVAIPEPLKAPAHLNKAKVARADKRGKAKADPKPAAAHRSTVPPVQSPAEAATSAGGDPAPEARAEAGA